MSGLRERVRNALAAVGIATAALGLLLIARPSLASLLTVPRAALLLLGVLAGVEGLRSIQTRRRHGIDGAEVPERERGIELSRPGDEFDRLLVRWSTWQDHRRIASVDDRVRRRLADVAAGTIMDRSAISRGEAEDRLEAGTWTDDPIAAAFLGGSGVPDPPWSVRLRGYVRSGSISRFYVERTIDAIAAVREER